MGFAGASKPAFQGKQRGLNILSSFAGRDQQLCRKQTNKQAAFLLLLPFFPCGLRCGTLRGDRSKQANRFLASAGWEAKANGTQSAHRVLLARPWPPSWARTELRRSLRREHFSLHNCSYVPSRRLGRRRQKKLSL